MFWNGWVKVQTKEWAKTPTCYCAGLISIYWSLVWFGCLCLLTGLIWKSDDVLGHIYAEIYKGFDPYIWKVLIHFKCWLVYFLIYIYIRKYTSQHLKWIKTFHIYGSKPLYIYEEFRCKSLCAVWNFHLLGSVILLCQCIGPFLCN